MIMDFSKTKKIYLIGIKGVGMTMLAQYFKALGVEVIGSDTGDKFMTDPVLKKAGIKIIEKFAPVNLPSDADLIIYSTAYNEKTNVEVEAALAGKIKTLAYAQALGTIFNQKFGIAVIGSHGKTTTTAWLGYVMRYSGLEPNVMVGALVPQFDGFSLVSRSDYLVVEADEYQNKLQYFQPKAVLLNNIDYDHPDFFITAEDYKNAFIEFIKKIPGNGWLIANYDDRMIRKVAAVNCRGKVISYAIRETADYIAYDLKADSERQYFKVKLAAEEENNEDDFQFKQSDLGQFSIQLAGEHNVLNALAVIAASIELGIELFKIRKHLADFTGTVRRLQVLGEFRGATIIDDYAHHPAEIKASLSALRQKYSQRKLTVVFHPHTYSRTKALLDDFAASFNLADELIVLDIYGSAREKQGGVHSQDLVEKIVKLDSHSSVRYIPTLAEAEKYLRENITRDEVIVLMGAGDIFKIGQNLINNLS